MPIKIKVHAKYLLCLFGNVCSFNTASLAEEMHNSPEPWAVLHRDIRVSTELGP